MSLSFHSNKESLYLQVYDHYKNLIMEHRLPAGSRMPSLRKCAAELKLSRTTIENAYLQLAADGYIIARAQSGYYVTDIAAQDPVSPVSRHSNLPPVKYDFASNGVDHESFRFDLWQTALAAFHVVTALADITNHTGIFHFHLTSLFGMFLGCPISKRLCSFIFLPWLTMRPDQHPACGKQPVRRRPESRCRSGLPR